MSQSHDIARHLGAVTRVVDDRERDGRATRVVIATRTYATDIADLWDAVTSAERIPRWFLPITGELRLGGRYQLKGNAGGEILRCDAPHHLALTWEFGGGISWVDVRLTAVDGGTRLDLEHEAHLDPNFAPYGPGAVGVGWELGLFGLALHLAGDTSVPPEASEAWAASDEGKAYMRGSTAAWGEADIAAGTPADEARAAAARTRAFYCGEPG